MTQSVREFRLADRSNLDPNGIPRDPISRSASADGLIPRTVLFSTLYGATQYDIAQGGLGYLVNEGGSKVTVNPASDPNTVIYVSFDEGANYIKMTPGVTVELPYLFERVFVKRATNLPNTGQSFELDFARNKAARITAESPAPGALLSGSALLNVAQASVSRTVCGIVVPARANRARVIVQNVSGGDGIYIGEDAATLASSGEYLGPGASSEFRVTCPIYALSDGLGAAAAVIAYREEYNP